SFELQRRPQRGRVELVDDDSTFVCEMTRGGGGKLVFEREVDKAVTKIVGRSCKPAARIKRLRFADTKDLVDVLHSPMSYAPQRLPGKRLILTFVGIEVLAPERACTLVAAAVSNEKLGKFVVVSSSDGIRELDSAVVKLPLQDVMGLDPLCGREPIEGFLLKP